MDATPAEIHDSEVAYAKINLALHIRKRLDTGYHQLETIFAFLNRGDTMQVGTGSELELSVIGPFARNLQGGHNLVLEAAHLLSKEQGVSKGAKLTLQKNLPISSGIGGGSADAAATLRLLNRFWNLNLSVQELTELSAVLGADVPACVGSSTCIGKGIGQDLLVPTDDSMQDLPVILANPLVPVSTPEIFSKWDGIDQGPLEGDTLMAMMQSGINGMTKAAIAVQPVISETLELLAKTRPKLARMSGSGATCFALFDNLEDRDRARREIRIAAPHLWLMSGELL